MNSEAEHSPDTGFVRTRPVLHDGDEPFRQSLADLSRQLANRTLPEPPPFDPKAGGDLPPEPREPARQQRRHRPGLALLALAAGFGLAAVIHVLIRPAPEAARTAANGTPGMAAVVPPPGDPAPAPTTADLQPTKPATADPPPPVVKPVAAPEPAQPPPQSKGKLEAYEIMEIQSRLKAAGLNPGPLDGVAGGQTSSAIKQYEANKGRPQTGKLDRNLLGQLRREPQRAQQ